MFQSPGHPSVETILVSYTVWPLNLEKLPPIDIHNMKTKDEMPPANAPIEFANGINIPKLNNPKTGPPRTPKIPSQA